MKVRSGSGQKVLKCLLINLVGLGNVLKDGLVERGTMSSYSSLLHHLPLFKMLTKTDPYRRRIKTEKKAKIVAAVLGTELIQFLAA